jgi:hypothetical protein
MQKTMTYCFHRVLVVAFLAFSIFNGTNTQAASAIPLETAKGYFAEAKSICEADHGQLWGVSLCGPLMFADPQSRFVVANQADARGVLKAEGGVFTGTLPSSQNIANTAMEWLGVYWTQVAWPLPEEKHARDTLMAHELFHRIQNQLRLPQLQGGDNRHLDTLDGRYYLQLEWRALARALQASQRGDCKTAIADALVFRNERYKLFPDAATEEHALELNEGLAEYTGVKLGNPTPAEQVKFAISDLTVHASDSTFVRSFAYATGPAYGLLLDQADPAWMRQIREGGTFASMLEASLGITLPVNLDEAARDRAAQYDGQALRAAETERETKRQQAIAKYKALFIDGPTLTLAFRHMNVQFDPRNLQPLGEAGTVYPNMRITDDWGILDASNGALMKADWSAVIVTAPSTTSGNLIKGDGWTLELKPGWKLTAGARQGDYVLASVP